MTRRSQNFLRRPALPTFLNKHKHFYIVKKCLYSIFCLLRRQSYFKQVLFIHLFLYLTLYEMFIQHQSLGSSGFIHDTQENLPTKQHKDGINFLISHHTPKEVLYSEKKKILSYLKTQTTLPTLLPKIT